MAPWLFAFVCGVLVGRAGVSFLTLFLAAAAALRCSKTRPQAARAFLIFIGFAWGFANGAPTSTEATTSVEVVRSDAALAAPRPVIVWNGSDYFQAVAPPGDDVHGSLRFKPLRGALQVGRSTFVPTRREAESSSPFVVVVRSLRAWFHQRIAGDRPFMRAWLAGTLLGERTVLPRKVADAFKLTGTYHLLAVSGLHVSLLVAALSFSLRAPFQLAYALRLLKPQIWRHLASGLNVLAAALAVIYLGVAGMPAAAQRSVFTYAVIQLGAVSFGIPPPRQRLLLAAVLQATFFPIGFLSEGSLMSWAAYLIVIKGSSSRWYVTQLKLTVLAAAAFGQLPLLGILANFVLVPVFSLLLVLGLFAVAAGPALPGRALILELHASFIEIVMALARLTEVHPWLSLSGDRLPVICQAACWVCGALFLLNTCRNLSIDLGEREDAPCRKSLGSGRAW